MIAPLIGATLLAAAIQFVFYCRSALVGAKKAQPSRHVLGVAGMENRRPGSGDFQRLLELACLCPEHGKDDARIRAVAGYYRAVRLLDRFFERLLPEISSWAKREQRACSHFAAVILDRRISSSRALFLERANRP
jgi:hypothetical protein